MRSLEYMLENWEKMEYETLFEAQHERYHRAVRGCKRGHPPIRVVQNGQCALCQKTSQKAYNDKINARNKAINEEKRRIEAEIRKKEEKRLAELQKEKEQAELLKHRCTRLDQITTGVLFFVKGRCSA